MPDQQPTTSFYLNWLNKKTGYTNMGSFTTALMEAYLAADSTNKAKLEATYPDYFTETPY